MNRVMPVMTFCRAQLNRGVPAIFSRFCALSLLAAIMLVPQLASAAISLVQSTTKFNSANATSITSTSFAPNPVAGHTIIVLAWSFNANNVPTISASDRYGNTYTSVAQTDEYANSYGYENIAILVATVTTTGSNFNVTVTSASNKSYIEAVALEYSGIGAIDIQNAVTGTSSTPNVATLTSTNSANELIVSVLGVLTPFSKFNSINPAAGYTDDALQLDNSNYAAGEGSTNIVSVTGIQSNTWTISPTAGPWAWAAGIATFRASITAPTVTTVAAAPLAATGATLNGTVSSNGASTAVTFNYGLTTGYGNTVAATQSPLAANATGSTVSASVTGLTCGTTYHFQASGVNSGGTINGSDVPFATAACPAPTVTTVAASPVATTSATLNGTVSSNGASTAVAFYYGLTTGYGSTITATQSPLAANAAGAVVSAAVAGLTCGTTYHFQASGVNSGGTTNGSDSSFTTSACVPASCNSGTISACAAGVINTYYPGVGTATSGTASITVGSSAGCTSLAPKDLVLVMQMQGAAINSTNTSAYGTASSISAGTYEYAQVSSYNGGTGVITLNGNLANSYTTVAATSSAGQQTFQVIRVPVYSSATLTSGLTAMAWNGSVGGVFALDVGGALALGGQTVDVSGTGFRGGGGFLQTGATGNDAYGTNVALNTNYRTGAAMPTNSSKGEGIAGTPWYVWSGSALVNTGVEGYPKGSNGMGAPANAGGGGTDLDPPNNDENTGGGGGGNGGSGGSGGDGWCDGSGAPCYGFNDGGFGGSVVSVISKSMVTLGGGGGVGTTNNGTPDGSGNASSGAAGGGGIMIRAGSFTGTATLKANGASASVTVLNDGSGGAGAGGAVVVQAASGLAGLTIQANGGTGGSNTPGSGVDRHGPGGGGGGGIVVLYGTGATASVMGGASGVSQGAIMPPNTTPVPPGGQWVNTHCNSTAFCAIGGLGGQVLTGQTWSAAATGLALGAGGPCVSSLDHILITTDGNGLTCTPEILTVTACANSTCTTNYTGSAVTGNITWAGTPGGTISPAFSTSIISGTTTVSLPVTTVQTVTLGASNLSPSVTYTCLNTSTNATDCKLPFASAGFIFSTTTTGATTTIPAQVAGTSSGTYYLRAVQMGTQTGACVAALTGATTVSFANQCNNPTSCNATNLMSVNGGTATTIAGNPNSGVSTYTSVPMTFDSSGNAPFTLIYSDVGQVTLYASKAASGLLLTPLTGLSNPFVVAPASFAFSGITAAPITAGKSFSATVTARNSAGAATPNFGKETTPEGVTLGFIKYQPTGAGASNGSFSSGTVPAFSNGAATDTTLAWSEVGTIDLTATLTSGSYLGSGLTASGTTGAGGAVGRFIPDHFNIAVTQGCHAGNFTYSGQPFTVTVTAMNGAILPTTTVNYDGTVNTLPNFAKAVTLTAWDAATGTNKNPGPGTLANSAVPYTAFSNGVASLSASAAMPFYTFITAPTIPTAIRVRAVDTDSVSSATGIEGTAMIDSGRLRLLNAYGSQMLPIPVPVRAEYYSSNSRWQINTADTCTTIPANAVAFSSSISACFLNSNSLDTSYTNTTCVAGGSPLLKLGTNGVGGTGNWFLFDSSQQTGYVNLAIDLDATLTADTSCNATHPGTNVAGNLPWLQYPWCTGKLDPNANIKFGSPKAPYIYLRELY